jgi:hypothetical protein
MTEVSREEETNRYKPRSMRLPGFIVSEEIGLGDVIKRVTYAMGIQPCTGCETRAAVLNSFMVFSTKGGSNK